MIYRVLLTILVDTLHCTALHCTAARQDASGGWVLRSYVGGCDVGYGNNV